MKKLLISLFLLFPVFVSAVDRYEWVWVDQNRTKMCIGCADLGDTYNGLTDECIQVLQVGNQKIYCDAITYQTIVAQKSSNGYFDEDIERCYCYRKDILVYQTWNIPHLVRTYCKRKMTFGEPPTTETIRQGGTNGIR